MALQLVQTIVTALPFVIQGAELVFKAFTKVEKIQPGQTVEIPTGYAISAIPADTVFETNHS